jgi:DNA-binding NarL/FixJ family response regulator
LFTLVHILHGVDERARLTRALARFAPALHAVTAPEDAPALASPPPDSAAPSVLTPREREVLGWMAAGLQNKEIAQKLDLSLATVRNHIHNTLAKLEVHSKLEAVSLAFRNGWVERERAARRI